MKPIHNDWMMQMYQVRGYCLTVAKRAKALLEADMGVTWSYAAVACDYGMIDPEDLRGHGSRSRRRFYLA